jgi:hypothetical protein
MRRSFREFTWPTVIRNDDTRGHFYELDDLLRIVDTTHRNPINPSQNVSYDDVEDVSWPGQDTRARVRVRVLEELKRSAELFTHAFVHHLMLTYDNEDEDVDVYFSAIDWDELVRIFRRRAAPHIHKYALSLAMIAICSDSDSEYVLYDPQRDVFIVRPSADTRASVARSPSDLLAHPPPSIRRLFRVMQRYAPLSIRSSSSSSDTHDGDA